MFIDSHTHLPLKESELTDFYNNAVSENISQLIAVSTNIEDSKYNIRATKIFDNLYCSVGIYPHEELNSDTNELINKLSNLIKNIKVVAIGECGIDIQENVEYKTRNLDDQIELFEKQIILANKHNLPIIIHNRNGEKEVFDIIKKYPNLRAVAHSFSQDLEFAKKLLDLGVYLSFSGFITHNSKSHLKEVVRYVPNDMFLIETDSPYIIPKGIKAKKNEPKNVKIVAAEIAKLKNMSLERVALISTKNTKRVFNKLR